jgi:protoporphyrinogen/coproporphyrinogen III oxidase
MEGEVLRTDGKDGKGRIAVVGGGVSGLAAAFHLRRAGYDVELIERDGRLGGRLGVDRLGDRPVMTGGKNIGRRYTAFRGMLAALGTRDYEHFGINTGRVKDGELLALDSNRRGSRLGAVLRMGAPRDLARLAVLAARIRADEANKFLGSSYFTELARRSDHAPLATHFGDDLTRTLLRPMTVRMNGAEPDEVYLGTFGTNLSLLMDSYDQLVTGVQPALDALVGRVTVRTDAEVESLVVSGDRVTGLRIGSREHRYAGVVLAVPAHAAARIVGDALPALGKRLAEVAYFPSTVVLVEYDRPVFGMDVRALAMDDGACSNAGVYGVNDRHIVRYTFSGRDGREPRPSDDRIEEWIAEGESLLARHLKLEPGRRVRTLARHWEAAYCAYVPYHGKFLEEVRCTVADVAGLELAGDYMRGASLEACCRSGMEAGTRMAAHLRRAKAVAA